MADNHHRPPALHDGRFGEHFDQEIDVRGVVWVTIGLAATLAISLVICYFVIEHFAAAAGTPEASPVAAANERQLPPGPRLQWDPEDELAAMRHEEGQLLDSWGWTDEGAGIVRIPIERAIDALVERGSVAALRAAPTPGAELSAPASADRATESAASSDTEDAG